MKTKQLQIRIEDDTKNKIEKIKELTLLDNSKIIRLSIDKLYESLIKNKYDLKKLEL